MTKILAMREMAETLRGFCPLGFEGIQAMTALDRAVEARRAELRCLYGLRSPEGAPLGAPHVRRVP